MFAILGDAANAYNAIPWQDAVPFIAILIALYWVKVKIDTRAGIGKKKMKELVRTVHIWKRLLRVRLLNKLSL